MMDDRCRRGDRGTSAARRARWHTTCILRDDDDDDDDVFVGTGLRSVGSKLPGVFRRLLDPTVLEARSLAMCFINGQ